jgi:hypothetical protein
MQHGAVSLREVDSARTLEKSSQLIGRRVGIIGAELIARVGHAAMMPAAKYW